MVATSTIPPLPGTVTPTRTTSGSRVVDDVARFIQNMLELERHGFKQRLHATIVFVRERPQESIGGQKLRRRW
jgi:hypothetical protein